MWKEKWNAVRTIKIANIGSTNRKAQQVETSISDETCFIRITKDVEQTDVFQKMKEVLSRHAGHIPVIVYFEKQVRK